MDKDDQLFPKDFFWGVSTASHQVEGGTVNQWSVWELAHAKSQAKTAAHRLSWLPKWETIAPQAENPENYVSGTGVDHYHKYELDFDIAKSLNMNAFRFGIEWSRIEPLEGEWDREEIEHYAKYIKELKSRGLEPFLNVWHWTLPTWFSDKGGFKKASNNKYFTRFVQKLADEFGSEINYVLTINEPNVYSTFSYMTGEWPPQEKNFFAMVRVIWNLTRVHRRAYVIFKKANKHIQVGVATQLANVQAKRPRNLFDEISVRWMRYFWNWWFLNRIKKYQDFVGFNYYFSDYYTGLFKRENPKVPVNDLGWYMEPEGLYQLLLRTWQHYKKPIIITENGVADQGDEYRQWWLEETILGMKRAISEGVELKGYFHWSLLDNFEWATGWWPKFGLVSVDREHGMRRYIRPSGKWLGSKILHIKHQSAKYHQD